MRSDLQTFITEYFEITKRPISTLTVEEYFTFVKNTTFTKNTQTDIPKATCVNGKSNLSVPAPDVKPKTKEEPLPISKEPKQKKTDNILELMRSVKG